jgi:hypothetical protein
MANKRVSNALRVPINVMVLVLALAGFLGVTPVQACSCIGPRNACEVFWDTPAIFLGRALDIRTSWTPDGSDYRSVLFEVEEAFKGLKESTLVVDIATGMDGGVCGYDFKVGERYLVFALQDPHDGSLETGICTVTHQVTNDDDEDLSYLRLLPTAARESWVFGVVETYWNPMGDHGERKLAGIDIILEGEKGRYQAKTDEQGNYRIDHLPAGTYHYRVDLPGDKESPRMGQIKIREKGCVELFFIYEVEPPGSPAPEEKEGKDPES